MAINLIYFSGTGNTKKVVEFVGKQWGQPIYEIDLSQKDIHLSHMTKRALNYRIDKITKKNNSFLVQLLYIDVVIMLCLNKAGIIKG